MGLVLIGILHIFHGIKAICALRHRAVLNSHEGAKTSHGAHWANHWLVIENLLVVILMVFHHLVPILPPGIARGDSSDILAHCHVKVFFLLLTLVDRGRWPLGLVRNLPILCHVSDGLSNLWRVGRVKPSFVVLETLLLLLNVHQALACAEHVFWRVLLVVATILLIDWRSHCVVTDWEVFSFVAVVYNWLRGAQRSNCFLNNIILIGGSWHTKRLLLITLSHWVESMRRAKFALVSLAVPWGILPSGVGIGLALHLDEMGCLDQWIWWLLPRLHCWLSRVIVAQVSGRLWWNLLIRVRWARVLGLVLCPLLGGLSGFFPGLFAEEFLATKSITLHHHYLLLLLDGWRPHDLRTLRL